MYIHIYVYIFWGVCVYVSACACVYFCICSTIDWHRITCIDDYLQSVCICVYISLYIYIYKCVCVFVFLRVCVCVCVCVWMFMCLSLYLPLCVYIRVFASDKVVYCISIFKMLFLHRLLAKKNLSNQTVEAVACQIPMFKAATVSSQQIIPSSKLNDVRFKYISSNHLRSGPV